MLQLLEERFPWLGKTTDEQISGADTVDQLTDLRRELKRRSRTNRRNGRKSRNFLSTDGSCLHFEISLPTRNKQ
jgi:hypothetical protein